MIQKITKTLFKGWQKASIAAIGALMISNLSYSQVILTENFATNPPAGWVANNITATTVNWTFNNPGARTITGGTPGFDANFAILDSDNQSATNENAALESPAFDASQAGNYILEYDNQYRNVGSGDGVPTVEVWNGTAWITVLTYSTAVADGYPNPASHKTMNITAATGSSAVAKVRFHWSNGSDDWWWAIDNVTVTRVSCVAPTATFTVAPNCPSNQFSVNVNITNMGSATSIGISDGTNTYGPATATGTIVAGPYATSSAAQTITLVHNVNTLCNVVSSAITYVCNDECTTATALTVNADYNCGVTASGSTVGATQSNETAPTVAATGVNDDVWYKFTATSTAHRIVLSNVSGTTDMAMAIYSGACGALVHVQSSDPNSMDVTGLTVGQEYKVRVYTYTATATTTATFTICVGTAPPPPANDQCSGATALTVNTDYNCTVTTAGTTVSATQSTETAPTVAATGVNDDVWYKFTATATSHRIVLSNVSGTTDMAMAIYSGACGALVHIQSSDPNSMDATGLTIGQEYKVRVYTVASATTTTATFSICVGTPPPPPSNDECSTATLLTVNPDALCGSSVSGTTVSATQSTETAPTVAATGVNDDVWYKFTAANATQRISLTNVSGSTDMAMAIYSGACGSLVHVLSSDPNVMDATGLTVGQEYKVRVYTVASATTTNATFTICVGTPIMTYDSASTTQASTAAILPGTLNQQILGIRIYNNGSSSALSATKFDFSTAGTMTAGEVTSAKVYYTGTSSTFATTTAFGTAVANPNGTFSIVGNQVLSGGTSATINYFWLVYDLNCTATTGHTVDATCTGVTVSSVLKTPTVTDPSGNRTVGAFVSGSTVADGDWNNPATWACGILPTSATNVTINNAITVTTSGIAAANVTIASGKSLTISAGNLTMGPVNGGNKTLSVSGTLAITGGALNVNGNVILGNGSTFNMSAGNMNIDPNDGTTGGSVASGTATFAVGTAGSDVLATSVTGGNILINDPPYAGTGYTFAMNTNTTQSWTGNTIQFGGSTGTNVTTSTTGFKVECYINSARLSFGNVIINGNAADRYVNDATYGLSANNNLTINSGSELRIVSAAFASFAGNVTNNGTLTITGAFRLESPAASLTSTLPSTNPQVISGTGVYRNSTTTSTANFPTLVINNTNSAGVTFADANSLLSGANTGTVSGTLTMTAGKVNVGANTLILGVSAATTGTYTYTGGTIIGNFKRWVGASTGDRSFDIGTGNVGRKVSINFTAAPTAGGSLTAKWNSGNPGSSGLPLTEGSNTYTNTSQNGYWTVSTGDGLTGGTYTVAMTLTGGSDAPDYSTVTIGKRPTSGDAWALVGTAVAPTGSASNFTVSRTGVTGFSDFVILMTSTPLSVKLSSFTGRNAGAVNILNWKTATENDASHFDVMRSNDGSKFEKLTTVNAKNVLTGSMYEFTDNKPFDGRNFYRLNMVDVNGKSILSDVVVLSVKSSAGLSLVASPNPVNQTLNVSINGKIDGKATIQVVDITGKIVQKIQLSSNDTGIDMSTLASGTYIIRYNDNSNSSVIKVTKN